MRNFQKIVFALTLLLLQWQTVHAEDQPFVADPKTFLDTFTKGKAEVSLFSGSLNYSYTLWVPAGRSGVQPQLGLTYSNVAHNFGSEVGYGWTLPTNGIYRTPIKGTDTIYTSNQFSADIFGTNEELIVVDEGSGIYAPKDEGSFTEYTFDGTDWTAVDRQGNIYTFGSVAGARQDDPADSSRVYKWMLERVEDMNGNFMTFTYSKIDGAIYPDEIRYTGHGSSEGIFKVKFNLEDKGAYSSYRTGFKVTHGKLIDSIDLISYQTGSAQTLLTYDLDYTTVNNAISLLDSITVEAGSESLPPTEFTYFDGSESIEVKKINGLYRITEPYGGTHEFTYKPASAYREPSGDSSNWLHFVVYTVFEHTTQAGSGESVYTTTYDYRDGHYFYDNLDAYKREYAGFGKVSVTDPAGNVRKLYFHQSQNDPNNTADADLGEFEDHISKKGRTYRTEQYDDDENLLQVSIDKWNKSTLSDEDPERERFFPFLARSTTLDYGENEESRGKATTYTYDSYGNPTDTVDYGEVTVTNGAGDFTDTGADKITTEVEYAYNTGDHLLGVPSLIERKDNSDALIGREKNYYDELSHGQVDVGNLTKKEVYRDATNFFTTLWEVNGMGLVTETTNARNYSTQIDYDTHDLYPETITNAKSQDTDYEYDPFFGVPLSVTDANGFTVETILDEFGRMVEQKVENDSSTMVTVQEVSYDLESTPASITQVTIPGNDDVASNPIEITQKTYFDGLARPIQVKKEDEGANYVMVSTVYDELGRVKESYLPKITTSLAHEAVNTGDPKTVSLYDALGRVKSVTNSEGTTSSEYNDWEVTVTDANGEEKDYLYDARGNLITVKEYLNSTPYSTVYAYNQNNNLTKITDAEGNEKEMTYDLLGRRLTDELLHDPSEGTPRFYTYVYDANGNITSRTDAESQTINYAYDELDRLLTENTTEAVYMYDTATNGVGRLASVTTADITKSYDYDLRGNVSNEEKVIDSVTYNTGFTYDLLGNVLSVTYPDTAPTTVNYAYNNAGQVEAITDYVDDFDYSPIGAVAYIAYANGTETTNTYDPAELYRLTHKETTAISGGGTSEPTTVTFYPSAGDGRVYHSSSSWNTVHDAGTGTSASHTATTFEVGSGKSGSTTYRIYRGFLPFDTSSLPDDATITDAKLKVYVSSKLNNDNDGTDWVTVVQGTQPSVTALTTADYDLAGSVDSPTEGVDTGERKDITGITTGQYLEFDLNATGIGWVSPTADTKLALREGHDVLDTAVAGSFGQYNRLTIRDSAYTGTSSDPILEVTYTTPIAPSAINAQEIAYTYDPVGNITDIVDSSDTDSAKTAEYAYDDLHRLTSATITGAVGGGNYAHTYGYSITGNITTKSDVGSYTYGDVHPQAVTSDGTSTYTYDANGSLTSAGSWTHAYDTKSRLTSSTLGGNATTYTYDEGKTRTKKVTGGVTTTYINPYYEKEGTTAKLNILAGGTKVATLEGASTIFHHTDHLTGSNAETNATGNLIQTLDYYPYGSTRLDVKAGSYGNDYKYTGKELDDSTGLYYYGARYYDPALGRFTSVDPVLLGGGMASGMGIDDVLRDPQLLNAYSYVRNNPLNYTDPDGEFLQVLLGMGAGAFIGAGMQALSDRLTGHESSFGDYVGAALGGAIQGGVASLNPAMTLNIITGGVAGGTTAVTSNYIDNEEITTGEVLSGVFIGGITGAVPTPKLAPGTATTIAKQMNTKLNFNLANNVRAETALNMFIGDSIQELPGAIAEQGLQTGSGLLGSSSGYNGGGATLEFGGRLQKATQDSPQNAFRLQKDEREEN